MPYVFPAPITPHLSYVFTVSHCYCYRLRTGQWFCHRHTPSKPAYPSRRSAHVPRATCVSVRRGPACSEPLFARIAKSKL